MDAKTTIFIYYLLVIKTMEIVIPDIINAADHRLKAFYDTNHTGYLVFHDLFRTNEMKADALSLLEKRLQTMDPTTFSEKIRREFTIAVITAAWQDVGYLVAYRNHEATGAEIVKAELEKIGAEVGLQEEEIMRVANGVRQTGIHETPRSFEAMVAHDACRAYYGKETFLNNMNRLRFEQRERHDEILHLTGENDTRYDRWGHAFLDRMKRHKFHLAEARTSWDEEKTKNIERLSQLVYQTGPLSLRQSRMMD